MAEYMKDLDYDKLVWKNKHKLAFQGIKMGYLRVHESDPTLEHCINKSDPVQIELEGKMYDVTFEFDTGWYFQGSMSGLTIEITPTGHGVDNRGQDGSMSGQEVSKSGQEDSKSGQAGSDKKVTDTKVSKTYSKSELPTKLTIFKFRYGLPDPNRSHDVRGYLPMDPNDTQNEADGYTRTQYAYLVPGKNKVAIAVYDFRGDEMSFQTATREDDPMANSCGHCHGTK